MKVLWEKQGLGGDGERIEFTGKPEQALRILIVDDHRDCAVSLCFLCRLWGHDAQCCFDGPTALQSADFFQPHVFLFDIAMPRMSGCDLAEELRRRPPFQDALFVAVSGYADELHRAQAAECGFDHYLAKPADLRELKNLLRAQWLRLDQALPALSVN